MLVDGSSYYGTDRGTSADAIPGESTSTTRRAASGHVGDLIVRYTTITPDEMCFTYYLCPLYSTIANGSIDLVSNQLTNATTPLQARNVIFDVVGCVGFVKQLLNN